MQPVNTGRPVVGCHDTCKYPLCLAYNTWSRVRYFDVLKSEAAIAFLVKAVLRSEASALLLSSVRRELSL